MSADRDIDLLLASEGFSLPEGRQKARVALEEAGLTRAGKQRISDDKLAKVHEALRARFFVHCASSDCAAEARASGREAVLTDAKKSCEHCGGSVNRRAETDFIDACRRHGVRKVLVVGGSPAVRDDLQEHLGGALELRMIDGTERRTAERARGDLAWSELVLIWGGSELDHKVSTLYTQVRSPKVVLVAKRGVAALLAAAVEHLDRRR